MKLIVAIIQPHKLEEVKAEADLLKDLEEQRVSIWSISSLSSNQSIF